MPTAIRNRKKILRIKETGFLNLGGMYNENNRTEFWNY